MYIIVVDGMVIGVAHSEEEASKIRQEYLENK